MVFWHIFRVFLSSQGRISQLEEDLNDERGSADRLMERLDKTKEQAGLRPRCRCFFIPTQSSHFVFANIHKFERQPFSDRIITPSPASVFIINRFRAEYSHFPSDSGSCWLVSPAWPWNKFLFLFLNLKHPWNMTRPRWLHICSSVSWCRHGSRTSSVCL